MTKGPWQCTLLKTGCTIENAMRSLNKSCYQIVLVVDDKERLVGTISDGDIRRAILGGGTLGQDAESLVNRNAVTAGIGDSSEKILKMMIERGVHQVPIVDDQGKVVSLRCLDDLMEKKNVENRVVVMVGGLGSRLGELTKDRPKPMLEVGGKPVLEQIIKEFQKQGFRHITLAVNYMAEKIETHFADGEDYGIKIDYLREDYRGGTAGALSLLEKQELPIIVCNGDVLTRVDYLEMLKYVDEGGYDACMATKTHVVKIPFGVVRKNGSTMVAIEEKPSEKYEVNAGIYVLSQGMIELIPKREYFEMTTLFEKGISKGYKCGSYEIDEYWVDIGRPDEFDLAKVAFGKN